MDALRAFGADDATLAQARSLLSARFKSELQPVLPENWFAVCVFDAMETQWTVASGLRPCYVGLRYEALPVVLKAESANPHRKPLQQLLPQLRMMQNAALPILNQA